MKPVLLLTTSLDPQSKGRQLADWMCRSLGDTLPLEWVEYRNHPLPDFDNARVFESETFRFLDTQIRRASGVILVSPVYNWSLCSNAKKIVECTGSHNPGSERYAAWFDKIVTFVCVGGLPESYMAYSSLAMSLMLDFKCLLNPYMVYASGSDFGENGTISDVLQQRTRKTLAVKRELIESLSHRRYTSSWEI